MPSCGAIDIYDYGNGSILVSWPAFPGITPQSFNVYVNGVLNQNVVATQPLLTEAGLMLLTEAGQVLLAEGAAAPVGGTAVVAGLLAASYNASAIPPAGDGSHRPESLPPVGQITDAQTYRIQVAAVVGGVEVAASSVRSITVQPNSALCITPMRRGRFPFPNTPGGY